MRKAVLNMCMLIGVIVFVLSFPAYMFLPDKLLQAIAAWQIAPFIGSVTVLFLILFPLSGVRQIRPLIQSGFTIVASLLIICLICVCPVYVDSAWGSFWSFAGFTVPVVGCTVLTFLAALFRGDWLTLILLTVCVIGCVSSAMASHGMLEDKSDNSSATGSRPPRKVIDASNAIWAMLSFFLPFGLYSTNDPRWLYLIPVVIALAACIRKGHRWAYLTFITLACAYIWLLIDNPGKLNVSPEFRLLDESNDINRHINSFGGVLNLLIKINGYIQHAVVAYALMMLLTPSSLRWFWQPKIEADPVGLRLDKEGSLLDERGNLLDKDGNLTFPPFDNRE